MEFDVIPEPLYVSDIGIPKASDIPPCPDCGLERTFEFQVMTRFIFICCNKENTERI